MKRFLKILKILILSATGLFVASQITAFVAYRTLPEFEKCIVRRQSEHGNYPWQSSYDRDKPSIEYACRIFKYIEK